MMDHNGFPERPDLEALHRKQWGSIGDFKMVSISKNENQVIIPPVLLEDYEDFFRYAKNAILVTYDVEYFNGPFLDDQKKFRRLTLHALGVRLENVPFTFKFVLDYNSTEFRSSKWEQRTSDLDALVRNILDELSNTVRLVKGTLELQPEIGTALSTLR